MNSDLMKKKVEDTIITIIIIAGSVLIAMHWK
jgi:hypothetical protein